MNLRSRFTLTIEDESRLEKKLQSSAPLLLWILTGVAALIFAMALGALFLLISPARSFLPGYLKDSERSKSEEQLLRLDSIQAAVAENQRYIDNLSFVLSPSISPRDSVSPLAPLSSDSLLPTSPEELRFVSLIREREKYNISVIAPLAAESMMFSPVNDECVISEKSKNATRAEVIMARGATVAAIADGKVISVSQSVREGGGSAVIIQHPKGFLSRLSRLGTILVEPGDDVAGGQVIAVQSPGNARKDGIIFVEMWYNGSPLRPFDYLGDSNSAATRFPSSDSERQPDKP